MFCSQHHCVHPLAWYQIHIHTPIFPSQRSPYSSLAGALEPATKSLPVRFVKPTRRQVPQYKTKNLSGGSPLCATPILFDYYGYQNQGVPLHDFITLSHNALADKVSGTYDAVLSSFNLNQITLHLLWKGYEHLAWSCTVPVSPSISRTQLGALIAMQLWGFIENVRHSDSLCPEWSLGSDSAIRFEDIILLGLYNIYDDIWQIDVAVDFPVSTSTLPRSSC